MPVISYPGALMPFTGTNEAEAADLTTLLYTPTDIDGSLAVINGFLDEDNLTTTSLVKREHTQRGAFVEGWHTSGTANLDYRNFWFADFDSSNFTSASDDLDQAQAIPGAVKSFFIRSGPGSTYNLVRFSWNICWTNDNGWFNTADVNDATHIVLRIFPRNSKPAGCENGQIREVNVTCSGSGASRIHEGRRKNRHWCGHHLEVLAPATDGTGWYTAGLYIIQDSEIKQARVWARSFIVRRMSAGE
jgi:hypothetical protein